MKTLKDLGQAIKAKYPQYADLSDEEVGRRVKAKFPEQYKDYGRTEGDIERLLDYYNPERGRLTSWWQRGKAESRTKLLGVLNDEQRLVIEQGAILEAAAKQGQKEEAEFQVFIAQHAQVLLALKHEAALLDEATAKGLTLANDQELKRAEGLATVDLDRRWKEIVQDLDAGDLLAISDLQVIKKLNTELAAARRERYEVLKGDDARSVKKQILSDYDKFISNLEARIHERTEGLVLPQNQQEAKRLTEGNSESPGRNQSEASPAEESLSTKNRRRGRLGEDVSDGGGT